MKNSVRVNIQELLNGEHSAGLDPFEWNELSLDEQLRERLKFLFVRMEAISQADVPRGNHALARIISTCSHSVHLARKALDAYSCGNLEKAEAISLDLDHQLDNMRATLEEGAPGEHASS